MEHKESVYLLNEEAEEREEDELAGSLKGRQPRPTKNLGVPADLHLTTASSNVSTLTNEEHDPEPEPVQEQEEQHDDPDEDEGFEVHAEHSFSSGGGPRDEGSPPAAETVDWVVAEGSGGLGVGEDDEEELQKSVTSFEHEQGIELAHEGGEPKHGDVGFVAPNTDPIPEYDLTAEKPKYREDLIEDFNVTKNHDAGIFASRRAELDDVYDLTAERFRIEEVVSPLKHEHEMPDVRFLSPEELNQEETLISFIEEYEPAGTEYDVQTVLDNQNTHDLFCPNCRSCITRRVILRKRRPRVPRFRPGGRGGRVTPAPEPHPTVPISEPEDQAPAVVATDVPAGSAEDHPHDRAPEVFRCLSCFSFIIPTGEGIICWIFGRKSDAGNVPEEREVPSVAVMEKPFFPFFPWKKKPAVLDGSVAPDTTSENTTQQKSDSGMPDDSLPSENGSVPSVEGSAIPSPLPIVNDAISGPKKVGKGKADSFSQDTASSPRKPLSIMTDQFDTYLKEPLPKRAPNLDDAVIKPDSPEVVAPSTSVTVLVGQTIVSIDQKPTKKVDVDFPTKNDHSTVTEVSSTSKAQSSISEHEEVVDSMSFPSPPQKVKDDAVKEPEEPIKNSTGDSVIVTIGTVADSQTASIADILTDVENPPQAVTQPLLAETRPPEVPNVRDFDVLKSIVYGGLVESIASLGVVSSAAGGGASTLNTLALALANMITGLFVLAHNLRELKNEQPNGSQAETDTEQDRYYQHLGRRGKFSLHATVAVISFLIFGSVAPITYGFSFRISDDRDYKLAAVAAASLLCILLLALAKARVRSKSYIKTAFYYLMTGFVASGISFVVGELLDKLLERLGLFESSSSSASVAEFLSEMSQSGSGWASY